MTDAPAPPDDLLDAYHRRCHEEGADVEAFVDEALETWPQDAVLALIGFKPDLGPIARWPIQLEKNCIRVGPTMQTNIPGVFAAGDIITYEGKLDLIATGFSEAAIAVNYCVHHIDPSARINPGHSTNLKIFKDRETTSTVAAASD
jgi:ferredoxin/flavodoxin---NADP+ reductase